MPIHILDEQVVAQIAAGEVVERPSSVVKELLENALDAGATHIRIALSGDGRQSIQISDDGVGIPTDEVELAFTRHATSKLQSADDLYCIRTLGFRGEALASIAAVSQLTATTRHRDDRIGTTLQIDGGRLQQRRSVGAPGGTVITVENLFFNTPARLKFMKKETTEKRHIAEIVSRYAMAYPGVRFILEQDGREVFRTNGSGFLADVIVSAMGLDGVKNMLEVDDEQGDIRVTGFTSAPSMNRADRSKITLFVNGRAIQDTSLTYAVIQAYHTLLMTGRFPVAVLMITLPPEELDVNVHPTKAEVRFRAADAVFSAVQRAVRRAVIDQAQTPSLRRRYMVDDNAWQPHRQTEMELSLDSPGQHARQRTGEEDRATSTPDGVDAPTMPRTLPLLRVIGQIGAAYIVAEGPAGMYMIDQHAAHERILYEQTVEYRIGEKSETAVRTTPEASDTNRFLREAVDEGCQTAVMETSSQAVHLHRCDFLDFKTVVFTNLTRDHLDYHLTMENYYDAKKMLFDGRTGRKPDSSVINIDDVWGAKLANELKSNGQKVVTFAQNTNADLTAERIEVSLLKGTSFLLKTPSGEREITS
ncbi:MAG: DNA mismatch repair endonuclease MutL, partial [Chloroflexota bacterium]